MKNKQCNIISDISRFEYQLIDLTYKLPICKTILKPGVYVILMSLLKYVKDFEIIHKANAVYDSQPNFGLMNK